MDRTKAFFAMTSLSTVFLFTIFFVGTAAVYGYSYGYGYSCGGGFGYGYFCAEKPVDKVDDEDDDEVKGSDEYKKYKYYQRKYKSDPAKKMYKEIKRLKKGSPEDYALYEQYRAVYKQFKHLSTNERREHLTSKQYAEFQAYKKYRGYKKYKEYRKEVGRD